jgi:purine-nucleoside phosphorylase
MALELSEKAIISPVISSRTPQLGPVAAVVGTKTDFELLRRRLLPTGGRIRDLFTGHFFVTDKNGPALAVTGPVLGAPAAAMVMETLIAWGVRKLLYYGWCGAIAPHVQIGDIVVPNAAVIDEGTSRHYGADLNQTVVPSRRMFDAICQTLHTEGRPYHEGLIWTTDALFRETPSKVKSYQQQGALAVEMETSALFTVAAFYQVEAGCLLVVSDELARLEWQPGFKDERFKASRAFIPDLIPLICHRL